MDFKDYWEIGCFGEYHDIYAKNLAEKFYKAGQQSKQAEIDKRFSGYQLEVSQVGQACVKWKEITEGKQAEIDAITKWVEENKKSIPLSEWHGYTTEEYVDADDLLELLK